MKNTNNPEIIATANAESAKRTPAIIYAEISAKVAEYNADGFTGDTVPDDLKTLQKEFNVIKKKETFRFWAETETPLQTACKSLMLSALAVRIDKTSATLEIDFKSVVFDIREFIDYLRATPTFRDKIAHVPATFKYDLENLAIAFDVTISDSIGADIKSADIAEKHKRSKANAAKVAEIVKMSKTQFKKTFTARAHDILPEIADILPADINFIRDGYTKRAAALTVKGAGVNVFVRLFAEVLHKHATGSVYRFEYQQSKEKTPTNPTTPNADNLPNDNRTVGDTIEDAKNGTTPTAAPAQEPTTATPNA